MYKNSGFSAFGLFYGLSQLSHTFFGEHFAIHNNTHMLHSFIITITYSCVRTLVLTKQKDMSTYNTERHSKNFPRIEERYSGNVFS